MPRKIPHYKLLLFVLLIVGCAPQFGTVTPEVKSYMEELKSQDVPFMIVGMGSKQPNSIGGVDIYVIPRITTPKTIKYIYFEVDPYNAVGDIQTSEVGWTSTKSMKVTGPISWGDKPSQWSWDTVWYNHSIHCIELLSVVVEYMDGSLETYKDNTAYAVDLYDSTKVISKLFAPEKFRLPQRWFCEDPFDI